MVNSATSSIAQPIFTNIDFESSDGLFDQWAGLTSTRDIGPHRIRSVRYRLAFRAPLPDRKAELPMPGGPPYMSRYCVGGDPCNDWARVRTVISEVALFNQAKANWSASSVTP